MTKRKLRVWPSDDQIRKMGTKRLLNIFRLVRAGDNELLHVEGDYFRKEQDLVVGVDDKLIEDVARHRSMLQKLRDELCTRENVPKKEKKPK